MSLQHRPPLHCEELQTCDPWYCPVWCLRILRSWRFHYAGRHHPRSPEDSCLPFLPPSRFDGFAWLFKGLCHTVHTIYSCVSISTICWLSLQQSVFNIPTYQPGCLCPPPPLPPPPSSPPPPSHHLRPLCAWQTERSVAALSLSSSRSRCPCWRSSMSWSPPHPLSSQQMSSPKGSLSVGKLPKRITYLSSQFWQTEHPNFTRVCKIDKAVLCIFRISCWGKCCRLHSSHPETVMVRLVQ